MDGEKNHIKSYGLHCDDLEVMKLFGTKPSFSFAGYVNVMQGKYPISDFSLDCIWKYRNTFVKDSIRVW